MSDARVSACIEDPTLIRQKRFSAEFKRQALRRANELGMTDALLCEEFDVSTRELRRWKDAIQER